MTLFFLLAALLVIAALAILLPAVLSNADSTALDHLQVNIDIARERQSTLKNALANGKIDQSTFDQELQDLEQALAADMSAASKLTDNSRGKLLPAAVVAVFVPVAAGALYLYLGMPKALDKEFVLQMTRTTQPTDAAGQTQSSAANAGDGQQQAPALNDLIPRMQQRLADNPDDLEGWKLLGRTYLTTGDFANAIAALTRAVELNDQDPDVLAPLAEATAMESGGALQGKPTEYLGRALDIDSSHPQSIWLMGIANQQTGDHAAAIVLFEALLPAMQDNPAAMDSVNELINRSRAALGNAAPPINQPAPRKAENAATEPVAAGNGKAAMAAISVSVSLDPDVVSQVSPDQSVFIYARAASGPPMPLAVSRHVVSDLPITVTLDESMAMLPAMTLGKFPKVTVGARVSQSGNAIAQPGDWYAELNNVIVADKLPLSLVIDQQK